MLTVAHRDEPETTGSPRLTVGDQLDFLDLAVVLLEQRPNRGLVRALAPKDRVAAVERSVAVSGRTIIDEAWTQIDVADFAL